jgi:ComF family protein
MPSRFRGLLDLLIPLQCSQCQAWLHSREDPAPSLCGPCLLALPWLDPLACTGCQQRPPRGGEGRCAACANTPSALESGTAAVWYTGPVEAWITRFKYPRRGLGGLDPAPLAVARTLACAAAANVPSARPEAVIPVPMHPQRFRSRGFNPPGVAARDIARAFGLPLEPEGLLRTRDTPSQTGLGRAERRRNVQGVFQARRHPATRVWLVDDVVTTGATLEACAAALRAAGALRVDAVALARTPAPATDLSGPYDSLRPPRSRRADDRDPQAS